MRERSKPLYPIFVTVPMTQSDASGSLSAREIEILSLASHGKTGQEIAARLAISERTVAFHVNNILEKLAVGNKTHAVAQALRMGLIK